MIQLNKYKSHIEIWGLLSLEINRCSFLSLSMRDRVFRGFFGGGVGKIISMRLCRLILNLCLPIKCPIYSPLPPKSQITTQLKPTKVRDTELVLLFMILSPKTWCVSRATGNSNISKLQIISNLILKGSFIGFLYN